VQERGLAKQVSFLGLRKDVPEILGALDGFVLPSLYEGLGIVLIEAQAAGVPCLVSDRVPEEADLKLGMVDKLPLEAPAERWAEGMSKLAAAASPDWAAVRDALIRHEYDITGSVRRLERVYAGGSFD
jgi:glycosyltransferase involved in cell wall biosynthesis